MIIISPYSKELISKNKNPKNYPWWKELVNLIQNNIDSKIIQIGIDGEEQLVEDFKIGLKYKQIFDLIEQCDFWISVDNFFQHVANHTKKSGVVLWGVSDPNIFGYPNNLNILKDRSFLRSNQFLMYDNCPYNTKVFYEPNIVIDLILKWKGNKI